MVDVGKIIRRVLGRSWGSGYVPGMAPPVNHGAARQRPVHGGYPESPAPKPPTSGTSVKPPPASVITVSLTAVAPTDRDRWLAENAGSILEVLDFMRLRAVDTTGLPPREQARVDAIRELAGRYIRLVAPDEATAAEWARRGR